MSGRLALLIALGVTARQVRTERALNRALWNFHNDIDAAFRNRDKEMDRWARTTVKAIEKAWRQ